MTFIYSKIWSWRPFLHCRDRNKGKEKEQKKNPSSQPPKKRSNIPQEAAGGNKRSNKQFISGGRLMTMLPDPILEGVGDSLLTATDRCAYTVSVPRMYKIVGREGVKALRSEKW